MSPVPPGVSRSVDIDLSAQESLDDESVGFKASASAPALMTSSQSNVHDVDTQIDRLTKDDVCPIAPPAKYTAPVPEELTIDDPLPFPEQPPAKRPSMDPSSERERLPEQPPAKRPSMGSSSERERLPEQSPAKRPCIEPSSEHGPFLDKCVGYKAPLPAPALMASQQASVDNIDTEIHRLTNNEFVPIAPLIGLTTSAPEELTEEDPLPFPEQLPAVWSSMEPSSEPALLLGERVGCKAPAPALTASQQACFGDVDAQIDRLTNDDFFPIVPSVKYTTPAPEKLTKDDPSPFDSPSLLPEQSPAIWPSIDPPSEGAPFPEQPPAEAEVHRIGPLSERPPFQPTFVTMEDIFSVLREYSDISGNFSVRSNYDQVLGRLNVDLKGKLPEELSALNSNIIQDKNQLSDVFKLHINNNANLPMLLRTCFGATLPKKFTYSDDVFSWDELKAIRDVVGKSTVKHNVWRNEARILVHHLKETYPARDTIDVEHVQEHYSDPVNFKRLVGYPLRVLTRGDLAYLAQTVKRNTADPLVRQREISLQNSLRETGKIPDSYDVAKGGMLYIDREVRGCSKLDPEAFSYMDKYPTLHSFLEQGKKSLLIKKRRVAVLTHMFYWLKYGVSETGYRQQASSPP